MLQNMDRVIAQHPVAGETTCAVAVVNDEQVYGASVGDSAVWVIHAKGSTNLSERQMRKPFIGTGNSWPVAFEHKRFEAHRVTQPGKHLCVDGHKY